MKKLVIYLDQNFISDIAKFKSGINTKVKPELGVLFDIIKKGVNQEKFIVPDSWSIKSETAATMDSSLINEIRSHLKFLGQVSFNPVWEIKDWQFGQALLKYLNKDPLREVKLWEPVFNDNPDKRLNNLDIDVSCPHIAVDNNFAFSSLQQIRDKGVSFKEQYQKEIVATKQLYKTKLNNDFLYFLASNKIEKNDAEKFIDSEEFLKIPNIDIFINMWSKDLSHKGRYGKNSDFSDIETISAYLPYCDIMTVDNYMATIIKDLGLDVKYNCKIFTMKDNDLAKMKLLLDKEQAKRSPANESIFSILCYLSPGSNNFEPEFVNFINHAINDYRRRVFKYDKDIYLHTIFVQAENHSFEKELALSIKVEGSKKSFQMNGAILSDMRIFINNFESINKSEGQDLEDIIKTIPACEKGKATALIPSDFNKLDLENTKDIDLIDDVSLAINNKRIITSKYKLNIIYNNYKLLDSVYIAIQYLVESFKKYCFQLFKK